MDVSQRLSSGAPHDNDTPAVPCISVCLPGYLTVHVSRLILSEPELCDKFGVSRIVVRQALREIELEGLVVRRKGKGTFIAEPKINESLAQKLTGFYHDMVERGLTPVTQVLSRSVTKVPRKCSIPWRCHLIRKSSNCTAGALLTTSQSSWLPATRRSNLMPSSR